MNFITKEESYVERRQLFKNIWDTAMNIDERDTEIMNKPKVIKTLRLDTVDKCIVGGKKKKQRIKNLRTVCNKILDFCDRQDADDIFYEQMAADGQEALHPRTKDLLKKRIKLNKVKKRSAGKANSMFSPPNTFNTMAKATTSERKDELNKNSRAKASRNTSPMKLCSPINSHSIKPKTIPKMNTRTKHIYGDTVPVHRKKVSKKKPIKKEKAAEAVVPGIKKSNYRHLGRSALIPTRLHLGIRKIMIQ